MNRNSPSKLSGKTVAFKAEGTGVLRGLKQHSVFRELKVEVLNLGELNRGKEAVELQLLSLLFC